MHTDRLLTAIGVTAKEIKEGLEYLPSGKSSNVSCDVLRIMPPKFKRNVPRDDVAKADDVEKETLLDHDSDPDEEMLFNRPSTSTSEPYRDRKMDSVRIQIKEVTDVMRENVQKVMERGEKMEDLEVASERLAMAGNEFHDSAKKAHRRAWMQNMKMRIIVGAIILTIVMSIIDTALPLYAEKRI
ncbi:vesicle-associated membrane protein 4-like isoform X6 [Diprion similis]|uniref:vesicle-associated membrane protein 4-like isoform X6 n=1 Tax=Diprion similis TaxID=362088 RepID=UPI001EF8C517|nr:vesicle-associated membrane protein 4-like isoform X6 [Diprion similis]